MAIKARAGWKKAYVEKPCNTSPNLCGSINQHARLWSKKDVTLRKEREQQDSVQVYVLEVVWYQEGEEDVPRMQQKRKNSLSLVLGCHLTAMENRSGWGWTPGLWMLPQDFTHRSVHPRVGLDTKSNNKRLSFWAKGIHTSITKLLTHVFQKQIYSLCLRQLPFCFPSWIYDGNIELPGLQTGMVQHIQFTTGFHVWLFPDLRGQLSHRLSNAGADRAINGFSIASLPISKDLI